LFLLIFFKELNYNSLNFLKITIVSNMASSALSSAPAEVAAFLEEYRLKSEMEQRRATDEHFELDPKLAAFLKKNFYLECQTSSHFTGGAVDLFFLAKLKEGTDFPWLAERVLPAFCDEASSRVHDLAIKIFKPELLEDGGYYLGEPFALGLNPHENIISEYAVIAYDTRNSSYELISNPQKLKGSRRKPVGAVFQQGYLKTLLNVIPGPALLSVGLGKPLEYKTILEIIYQIANALDYMQEKGLRHCDVKETNILVSLKPFVHAVVCDFGGVRQEPTLKKGEKDRAIHISDYFGAPGFVPPETVLHHYHTRKSDVFSLGSILLKCLGISIVNDMTFPEYAASLKHFEKSLKKQLKKLSTGEIADIKDIRLKRYETDYETCKISAFNVTYADVRAAIKKMTDVPEDRLEEYATACYTLLIDCLNPILNSKEGVRTRISFEKVLESPIFDILTEVEKHPLSAEPVAYADAAAKDSGDAREDEAV
jgi:serine/threonine protein kinase